MVRVQREIEIAAAPEAIYEIVMDPLRLKDWVTIHKSLERAPNGSLRMGSTLTQRLKLAGRGFRVDWTVIENRRAERVVWEGKGPVRSRARVTYSFEARDGHTRFVYGNEYDLPGGPLGRIAGPIVKRATTGELDKSLERLRALVE